MRKTILEGHMRYTSPYIMCHPYYKCANKNIFILQKSFWRVKLQEHYDETTLTHNTQLERIIHNHLIKFWVKKEVQRIRHNLIKWTQICFCAWFQDSAFRITQMNPPLRTSSLIFAQNQMHIDSQTEIRNAYICNWNDSLNTSTFSPAASGA